MDKHYKIQTIEDILEVVDSNNIENFLVDFGYFLRETISQKTNPMRLLKNGQAGMVNYKLAEFTWIDDGKHEGIIRYVDWNNEVVSEKKENYGKQD